LCHALQEGENELTAKDAYWLGLIDEVIGEDLYTIRDLMEYEDDPAEEVMD
jgi:enoyl-CoA hydratase/carnithine racemase